MFTTCDHSKLTVNLGTVATFVKRLIVNGNKNDIVEYKIVVDFKNIPKNDHAHWLNYFMRLH